MSNTIKISACDNELYLIAYKTDGSNSYQLAHLKSGNNNEVDVTIEVECGDYQDISTFNGINDAIKKTYSVKLPVGTYKIVAASLNWGGPWAYGYHFNGKDYVKKPQAGDGEVAVGPELTVTNAA